MKEINSENQTYYPGAPTMDDILGVKSTEELVRQRTEEEIQWNEAVAEARVTMYEYLEAEEMKQEKLQADAQANDPSTLDVWAAQARQMTVVGSHLNYNVDPRDYEHTRVDGFNVFARDPETGKSRLEGYEEYSDSFIGVFSPEMETAVKNSIDMQRRDRKAVSEGGITSIISGLSLGLTDLPNVIAMMVPLGGATRTAVALRGSLAGLAGLGASEAMLHQSQDVRTLEESIFNITAGALLDGVLVGAGKGVDAASVKLAHAELSAHLKLATEVARGNKEVPQWKDTEIGKEIYPQLDSAGAARADLQATGAELRSATPIAKLTGFEKLAMFLSRSTLNGQLLQSKNLKTRQLLQEMSEIHMEVETGPRVKRVPVGVEIPEGSSTPVTIYKEVMEESDNFLPQAIETMIKLSDSEFADNIRTVMRNQKASGLSPTDFQRELARAARSGDVHPNAHVQKAAQEGRPIFDKLFDDAYEQQIEGTFYIKQDPISGDVTYHKATTNTAESFLTRRFDPLVVREKPLQYKQSWRNAIEYQHPRDMANWEEAVEEFNANYGELYEELKAKPKKDFTDDEKGVWKRLKAAREDLKKAKPRLPADEAEWEVKLEEIFNNTLGSKVGDLPPNGLSPSGKPLYRRANVPDKFFSEGEGGVNFLVQDWESLATRYHRSLSPKIEFAKRFGKGEGKYRMEEQLVEMQEQINREAAALEKAGKIKESQRVRDQGGKDLDRLKAVRDLLLGEYAPQVSMGGPNGKVINALRGIRGWNVSTKLGSMLIASVPEYARVVTYNGIAPYIKAFMRDANVQKINGQFDKLPSDEINRFIMANELHSLSRASVMTDADNINLPSSSKFDRTSAWIADKSITFSGQKHYNGHAKSQVAYMVADKIIRGIKSGDPKVLKGFRHYGLDDNLIQRISQQLEATSDNLPLGAEKSGGLWVANTGSWTDAEARRGFHAAIIKETDKVVLTPGIGDRPQWMHEEWGKTLMQFKTFMMASINRLTIPLMQERGIRPYQEMVTMAGFGTASYYAYHYLRGKEPSDDPWTVGVEVVDRTGMIALPMMFANATGRMVGMDLLGRENISRLRNQSQMGNLLGPSYGMAETVVGTGTNIFGAFLGDTKSQRQQSAYRAARGMRLSIPTQNHFAASRGWDAIEESWCRMLGGGRKCDRANRRKGKGNKEYYLTW